MNNTIGGVSADKVTTRRECILFVEDERDDYLVACKELRKLNVSNPTYRVGTVEEMIRYLEGQGEYAYRNLYPLPCLIVIDVRLPGSTGLQAQAYVRSKLKFRKIPIIAISSEEQLTALRSAVAVGAEAYLVKPFDAGQFARVADENKFPIDFRAS